jgi:hypothetical protein
MTCCEPIDLIKPNLIKNQVVTCDYIWNLCYIEISTHIMILHSVDF